MNRHERIVINPLICHRLPSVRGLRYPVTMILDLMASGIRTRKFWRTTKILKSKTFWRV